MFCMETARFAQLKKNRMAIFSKIYMKTIHKLYGIVRKLYENCINRFHRACIVHALEMCSGEIRSIRHPFYHTPDSSGL